MPSSKDKKKKRGRNRGRSRRRHSKEEKKLRWWKQARISRKAERKRQEAKERDKKEWNSLKPFRTVIQHYEFPYVNHIDWEKNYENTSISDGSLVGKYEIYYSCCISGDHKESRTITNSFLTLEMDYHHHQASSSSSGRGGRGVLKGRVTCDQTEEQNKNRPSLYYKPLTLTNRDVEREQFLVRIEDDKTRRLFDYYEQHFNFRPPIANLKRIKNREAMAWVPREEMGEPGEKIHDDFWFQLDSEYLIRNSFQNLKEADNLVRIYKEGYGPSDWLCRHIKGMSPEIAKLIHDFVAWKPLPVLFLEPGDLMLDIEYMECMDGPECSQCRQYLLARKVHE